MDTFKLRRWIVSYVCIAAIAFCFAGVTDAQEIFGGRGIGSVDSTTPFSKGAANQREAEASKPLFGLFKKPNIQLPKFDLFKNLTSGQSDKPVLHLPSLSELIPKRDPAQPSMLTKIKTKTDAFFSKAFSFQKMMPEKEADRPTWDDVRKDMEQLQAAQTLRGETSSRIRSASQASDQIRR